MQTQERFIGVDVSKDHLDGAGHAAPLTFQHPNDLPGIAAVVALLQPLRPALIVLEATGGRELPLAGALANAVLRTGRRWDPALATD